MQWRRAFYPFCRRCGSPKLDRPEHIDFSTAWKGQSGNMLAVMLGLFRLLWRFGRGYDAVVLENLALRQQLAIYKRAKRRPQLVGRDRWFWIVLSAVWKDWRRPLFVVHPDTVVRWQRERFRRPFCRWPLCSRVREFPAEVAGVALIESSSPQQLDEVPGFRTSYEQDKRDAKRELWEDRLRVWSGWERLLGHCHVPAKDFPGWAGQYNAMACRPDVDTDESELSYFEESFKQAGRLASFGSIPLVVISRDPNPRREGMTERQMSQQPVFAPQGDGSQNGYRSLAVACTEFLDETRLTKKAKR
jgi:hypothetical protein